MACKNKEKIESLILVSPAGVGTYPNFNYEEHMKKRKDEGVTLPFQSIFPVMRFFWNRNLTPQGFIRLLGPLAGGSFIRGSVGRKMKLISQEERDAFSVYLY